MKGLLTEKAWPSFTSGAPLVLVPLGSTEQHGPHLPLSTDSVIATAVATALAGQVDAIVAPTIQYGASGEHQSFPGTTSIGHQALQVMIIELVRSLSTWADRIRFVNGHGGNVQSLTVSVPQLIAEGHRVAWLPCTVRHGDAHAGRIETSLMLHLAPALVEMAEARAGNVAPVAELLPAMRAGGTRAVSASGVLGDPTGASAAEGTTLFEQMVDAALLRLREDAIDERGCLE